ncbi:MAG: arginine--tRNA ligase, partial [Patescibacteria group bacterium]|nr:arginine--tRNA ligase [Patescibacteria group bacterium]
MIREQIERAIKEHLGDTPFVVERPREMAHGDYATNAALVAKVDASELAGKLKIDGVEKVEVVGKFINFFLSREAILEEVESAAKEKEWGSNDLYKGQKIMVEYTDPNPFKEFHIGHLMSNAVGEAIVRVLEVSGAEVKRANYQGDVGPHVAKAIWGKMHPPAGGPEMSWGEAYVYGNAEYEVHKVEIDEINKKVYEKSDEQINKLYTEGREESLKHFEEIYKTLGTTFDYYFFESETAPIGLELIRKHSDIFEESDGAMVFRGEEYGLHTRVFVNSLGLPTYEAKELGLVEAKKQKGNFDLSLTVTANETKDYFKVVRKAAEMVFPDLENKMIVRFHGMLRLTSGKMSSRAGNVITGESLINDLTEAARNREDVAVGAIKYVVLKQGSGKDIIFDQEKSLSLEGDSGPYLQYAHTRALSLTREAEKAGIKPSDADAPKEASQLERLLLHYPDVVARAASELEPHYVTTYLTELAAAFNSWY